MSVCHAKISPNEKLKQSRKFVRVVMVTHRIRLSVAATHNGWSVNGQGQSLGLLEEDVLCHSLGEGIGVGSAGQEGGHEDVQLFL